MAERQPTRPLYEGGKRCGTRRIVKTTYGHGESDCFCARDPHDDGPHTCVCGSAWEDE